MFETRNDYEAYLRGMSTSAYEDMCDAITADEEELAYMGNPDLELEERSLVPEQYVS